MQFAVGSYIVELNKELDYQLNSVDNRSVYDQVYLQESDYLLPTKIGIRIIENGINISSAIIGAEGGASALHETSQIIEDNRIVICCSDTIFCLEIPSLALKWKTQVDQATSFEVYKIDSGYIVHGELQITRIDGYGEIVWQQSGADIFVTPNDTEDFLIDESIITATDWSGEVYKWDLDGRVIK